MLVFCAVLYCLPVFDGRRITRWVLAPETLFLELTARPAVASWGHAAWVAVLGVPSVLTLPLQILYAGGSRFFALKTYELFLKVSGHLILQNILYKRACSSVFRRSSANQSRWGAILIIPPPPPHRITASAAKRWDLITGASVCLCALISGFHLWLLVFSLSCLNVNDTGLAREFVWVFHNIFQKNPNELFGHPTICVPTAVMDLLVCLYGVTSLWSPLQLNYVWAVAHSLIDRHIHSLHMWLKFEQLYL